MPLITPQRKKQRNLIAIFIVVVLITLGVLYIGRLRNTARDNLPKAGPFTVGEEAKQLRIDTSILKDERFLNLVPYEMLSRDIETGRANPFAPY